MPELTDFKAFIFDLDGLVLDTEPTYFAAWEAAVLVMGYQTNQPFSQLSGLNFEAVQAQIKAWCGEDFNLEQFCLLSKQLWQKYIATNGISVKKGVLDLLDFAQQNSIPYSIATNSLKPYAEECLRVAGIVDQFPLLVTKSDIRHPKPAPDIFFKAAELLSVNIKDCIVFEDSPAGIQAGNASGAYTIFVPSITPPQPEAISLCDWIIDDLTQVYSTMPSKS